MKQTFQVKVLNSIGDVMFVASIDHIYVSAFSPKIKPYVSDVQRCPQGLGNSGKDKEYIQTISGLCMSYADFRGLMDSVEI